MTTTPLRPLTDRFDLRAWGDRPALVTAEGPISYRELHDRVEHRRAELGSTRRLVAIEGANRVEAVVDQLAALAGQHPVLLVPAGTLTTDSGRRLLAAYDPDVVIGGHSGTEADGPRGWRLEERRPGTRHDLHPDLALLLSTSGSSGSPKQVRLSLANVVANARAIASYLDLTPDDRAATSLPLHYCYGLSVLHSHLLAGASVWLTEESVVEDEFWRGFAEHAATSFAGVPHTFELLDRSGFADRHLPSLRYATQAGGALAPDRVVAWAELGRERGFDFFVMYGATEATARMAYLPPHLAARRPETVGVPVPGGDLRIDDGELVYEGPNVMLGYATVPADLALGRTTHELRTGDLAVQHEDGLFEIVGRRSRIAKLFGLRIDLGDVEQLLVGHGLDARALEHDGRLVVLVRHGRAATTAAAVLTRELCLPPHALSVQTVARFPTTDSGKTDYPALRTHVHASAEAARDDLRAMYAIVLGRPDAVESDSFVGLGGDSLSYVEVSLRLERMIGRLPDCWQERSIAELSSLRRRPRRWTALVELPVALRAIAIVAVVGSHTEWFDFQGGAHVLLALLGFNLARFQLAPGDRQGRTARLRCSLRDLLIPSVVWIGAVAVLTGKYTWSTAFLVNSVSGPPAWNDQWQYWFLESAAWTATGLLAVLAVPRVHDFERRQPWRFGLLWLAAAMAVRLVGTGIEAGPVERYAVPYVAWAVALGYLAARATSVRQRLVVSVLTALCTLGFFGEPVRELIVVAGLLLVLWVPRIVLPRPVAWLVGPIASASLFIYLTHWVVYPPLDADHDVLAALLSVAVGVATWRLYGTLRTWIGRGWARVRPARRRSGGLESHLSLVPHAGRRTTATIPRGAPSDAADCCLVEPRAGPCRHGWPTVGDRDDVVLRHRGLDHVAESPR